MRIRPVQPDELPVFAGAATHSEHVDAVHDYVSGLLMNGSMRTEWCYWSFHNLGDIYLFKMKVMFYILWYAPGWEDVIAQYIGGDALSCYRSVPSGEKCLGDREATGCTLGQCITLAYKMAARWTERS